MTNNEKRNNDAYIVGDKWLVVAETWHAAAIAEADELALHVVVGIHACAAKNGSYGDMDDDGDAEQVLVDLPQVKPCCCNKWERQDQTQDTPG